MNNALIHPLNEKTSVLNAYKYTHWGMATMATRKMVQSTISICCCSSLNCQFFHVHSHTKVLMDEKCKNAEFVEIGLKTVQQGHGRMEKIRYSKIEPNQI